MSKKKRTELLPDMHVHQQGDLSVHDDDGVATLQDCDVGIQTATDGRIWICVNGAAFIRFKPKRNKALTSNPPLLSSNPQ